MPSIRLLGLFFLAGIAAAQNQADIAHLLDGVREIAPGSSNGSLIVIGDRAFPVVNAPSQAGSTEPLIAAARLGQGSVVVFGNTVVLEHNFQVADSPRLTANVLRWAAGDKAAPSVGVYHIGGQARRLKDLGIDARDIATCRIARG